MGSSAYLIFNEHSTRDAKPDSKADRSYWPVLPHPFSLVTLGYSESRLGGCQTAGDLPKSGDFVGNGENQQTFGKQTDLCRGDDVVGRQRRFCGAVQRGWETSPNSLLATNLLRQRIKPHGMPTIWHLRFIRSRQVVQNLKYTINKISFYKWICSVFC